MCEFCHKHGEGKKLISERDFPSPEGRWEFVYQGRAETYPLVGLSPDRIPDAHFYS